MQLCGMVDYGLAEWVGRLDGWSGWMVGCGSAARAPD